MTIQLQARVSHLESEVRDLRQRLESIYRVVGEGPEEAPRNLQGPRQMCPKCGEKPAYHLHVINCRGKKGAQI